MCMRMSELSTMLELRGSVQPSFSLDPALAALGAIENLWLMTATIMVLFMQAGFLMLEAGNVRSKNTINVAQKNITDLIVCGCVFLLIGAPIMFGAGSTGLFGFGGYDLGDVKTRLMFMYQFAFCATAATIISGAVSERMNFSAYILLIFCMAGLIYPVFGHLAWGNTLIPDNPAFLADLGFLDYAGSTVVHVIGGGAALAAALVLGPRLGRYKADGSISKIRGHSTVLSNFGTMVLMIGWIGFNAGASNPNSPLFSQIVLNTIVAFSFGGAAGLIYSAIQSKGKTHPRTSANGILGGLVAITAGCAFVNMYAAAAIGLAGGLTAVYSADLLSKKLRVDDPVDAIAVHLGSGFVGTLLVAIFAASEFLTGSRLEQLLIQASGSTMAFVWSFAVTFVALKVIAMFVKVRVSPEAEQIGLNLAEHDDEFDSVGAEQLLKDKAVLESGVTNLTDEVSDSTIDPNTQLNALTRIVANAKTTSVNYAKAQSEIEELGAFDQLTQLSSRKSFCEATRQAIEKAAESGEKITILYSDLDGFKAINDGFGHHAGDLVLQSIAARLLDHAGVNATVSRFGGDEFVLMLPGLADGSDPDDTVNEIIKAINEVIRLEELELFVGISIGAAVYPQDGESLDELILKADMALYDAKARGKGRCVRFHQSMQERAQRRRELETDMRAGIDRDEFFAHYQPLISLRDNQLNGFEALMRWEHPVHGMLMPDEFISIAESTGLIVQLSETLVNNACQLASEWPLVQGKPLTVSVNISPVQFARCDVVDMIQKALDNSGLAAERLEIEVTENMLIENVEETKLILKEISKLGVRVAVDDFGTGYSSLTHLQNFPVNCLKVDRAFIKEIEANKSDHRIAKAIVDLGKSLGMTIVAEGVETEGQRALLKELECDQMQGFLFSPPVSVAQTLNIICKANGDEDEVELEQTA